MDQTNPGTQNSPMSAEAINDLRRRVLAGETVSNEELRVAISTLRQGRMAAMQAKATKAKAKKENAEQDLNDMLGSLGL